MLNKKRHSFYSEINLLRRGGDLRRRTTFCADKSSKNSLK